MAYRPKCGCVLRWADQDLICGCVSCDKPIRCFSCVAHEGEYCGESCLSLVLHMRVDTVGRVVYL